MAEVAPMFLSVLNQSQASIQFSLDTECPVISCPCYTRKFCHAAPRIVLCKCVCVLVAQSCLTLCYPMDCSPPDSFVHGILQARILEWIAISFSTSRNHLLAQSSWVSIHAKDAYIKSWHPWDKIPTRRKVCLAQVNFFWDKTFPLWSAQSLHMRFPFPRSFTFKGIMQGKIKTKRRKESLFSDLPDFSSFSPLNSHPSCFPEWLTWQGWIRAHRMSSYI